MYRQSSLAVSLGAPSPEGSLLSPSAEISTPLKLLFASMPTVALSQQGDARPEVALCTDPTRDYGVGLARIHFSAPSYSINPRNDQHLVWLNQSGPIPIIARVAGRRTETTPGPGSFCVYPAEADCDCEAGGPGDGLAMRVSAECLATASSQLAGPGCTLIDRIDGRDEKLFQIGSVMEVEAAAGQPNGMLFWSSLADAFIRHLTAHHLSAPATPSRGPLSQKALKRLDAFIHGNLEAPLALHVLAAVIGCDRFHFAHCFRAAVGMSPHRYVMRLRVARAFESIRSGSGSLADIAITFGFADQSHLCRWIRRVYNVRPTDLRS